MEGILSKTQIQERERQGDRETEMKTERQSLMVLHSDKKFTNAAFCWSKKVQAHQTKQGVFFQRFLRKRKQGWLICDLCYVTQVRELAIYDSSYVIGVILCLYRRMGLVNVRPMPRGSSKDRGQRFFLCLQPYQLRAWEPGLEKKGRMEINHSPHRLFLSTLGQLLSGFTDSIQASAIWFAHCCVCLFSKRTSHATVALQSRGPGSRPVSACSKSLPEAPGALI